LRTDSVKTSATIPTLVECMLSEILTSFMREIENAIIIFTNFATCCNRAIAHKSASSQKTYSILLLSFSMKPSALLFPTSFLSISRKILLSSFFNSFIASEKQEAFTVILNIFPILPPLLRKRVGKLYCLFL